MTSSSLNTGLTLIATPIGNMQDISLRAVLALSEADEVLCENTRVSRKLLSRHNIKAKLGVYHDHNASSVRPRILKRLKNGRKIVLISDAGTPTISDPGYQLVNACLDSNIEVSTIPGPTALIAALSISGLPTDKFYFGGFLPAKTNARQKTFNSLKQIDATLVFYESPARLAASLVDAKVFYSERPAAIARELTKLYEEVKRGTVSELSEFFSNTPTAKGEVVFLISPPLHKPEWDESALNKHLLEALESHTLRDSVKLISKVTGVPRSSLYKLALTLKTRGP